MLQPAKGFRLYEQQIQNALYHELLHRGHKIIVPNVSWSYLNWEADLISITKADYLNEFEIKISKADFEKDFTKRKHYWFKKPSGIKSHRMPNYFWYVAPIKAIPICIPDYAGLIEVIQNRHYIVLDQVKKPVVLHKKKIPVKDIMAILRTIMFKYWNLSHNLERLDVQRQLF